ncbi:hypothetical protein [Methylobacterium sp. E-045]|uniref:hypothetical protein n=1 Tax=Methylobacterium sp. E-045 TaxID=2836575 RepID=UPI001FBA4649|nr:hypothetical protein [Methylobacterium sp. E-045]MCJ2132446.1 hypothetical protein [Methylobacterium sp. E-045]
MAEAIGLAILTQLAELGAVTASVAVPGTAATVIGSVTIIAATTGAQLAIQALTAEKPRNEAQQATMSQAVGPRVGIYGRAMVGGIRFFWDARNGNLFQGIVIAGHRIDGIEQYWIGDKAIHTTLGENGGTVSDWPYNNRVRFDPFLGDDNQAASALLQTNYPEIWTPQHQLNGLAYVVCVFNPVKKEDQQIVYPQGYATVLRFVVRGARVWNPADGAQDPTNPATWLFSENAGLCIMDYLRRKDGARFPLAKIDVPSFTDHAALCAEGVKRKDGTTEPRYRIGGTYLYNEAPKDVLARMGATCDGTIVQGPSGKYGIRGGRYRAPLVNIPTKQILSADVEQGVDRIDGYNRLTVAYTEPDNFYQATQVAAYQDAASQARIGVVDQSADLIMVPSWTQAARLAKIRFKKDNPTWTGSLGCQLPALDALGSENVHVTFDPVPEIGSMFDEDFAVSALNIEGDASAVGLGISSISTATYAWDPALEEPVKPTTPQTISWLNSIAAPTGVSVVADRRVIAGGNTAVWAILSWVASNRPDLTAEAQYRLASASNSAFRAMALREDAVSAEAGPLTDTSSYVFRVRFRSGGTVSDWSDVVTLTATADGTAPNAPAYTSATLSGTTVTHAVKQSGGNARTVQLFRATGFGKVFADAALSVSKAVDPYQTDALTDTISLGYITWWLTAQNASGVASAASAPLSLLYVTLPGNVTQYPNDLSNGVWTKSGTTVALASSPNDKGPDGNTASLISEITGSTNVVHTVAYKATGLASGSKIRAVWGLKPSGRTAGRIDLVNSSGTGTGDYVRTTFDLTAGTISVGTPSGTTFSGVTATIQKVSADYWLLIVTANTSASAGASGAMAIEDRLNLASAPGTISYAGDSTKGMLAWACSFAPVT